MSNFSSPTSRTRPPLHTVKLGGSGALDPAVCFRWGYRDTRSHAARAAGCLLNLCIRWSFISQSQYVLEQRQGDGVQLGKNTLVEGGREKPMHVGTESSQSQWAE